MTTLILTLTSACAAGGHLNFTLSGAVDATFMMEAQDFTDPLTVEDAQNFARIVGRMAKAGRTLAQTKTLLLAGVTVTI